MININQAESLPTLISRRFKKPFLFLLQLIVFLEDDVDTIKEDDPRTRPIVVGQETLIEIDRGQSGLGLSVVGGIDTQLVMTEVFFFELNKKKKIHLFSQQSLFMIFMMAVRHNVMDVCLLVIKYWKLIPLIYVPQFMKKQFRH